MTGGSRDNKARKLELEKSRAIKCGRCKPHKGENAVKQARPDKYKDHRKPTK